MSHRIVSVWWDPMHRRYQWMKLYFHCDCGRRGFYYVIPSRDNYEASREFSKECSRAMMGCVTDVLVGQSCGCKYTHTLDAENNMDHLYRRLI